MDEELRQIDLAIVDERRLANDALDALRAPQAALRTASADYIESVAQRRVDASRHASVEVMARFSDGDIAELRFWTEEQIALVRAEVERDIESCDFWIPETSGLSPTDVNGFGTALVPRPKDSEPGIPQSLVLLFERCLLPLRRGLAAIGLAAMPTEAGTDFEMALVRAWRVYRETAIECLAQWSDVDERYQASVARFQEMRWELAGRADIAAPKEQRPAVDLGDAESAVAATLAAASDADHPSPEESDAVATDAIVRSDSETLIPIAG